MDKSIRVPIYCRIPKRMPSVVYFGVFKHPSTQPQPQKVVTGYSMEGLCTNAVRVQSGVIAMRGALSGLGVGLMRGLTILEEDSELDLINRLTDLVREKDPDILAGYEVQSSSWGYVIERARLHFGMQRCQFISDF
jgi:hypothetical protein